MKQILATIIAVLMLTGTSLACDGNGKVQNTATGFGVNEAKIFIGGALTTIRTSEDGLFNAANLVPGQTVTAYKNTCYSATQEVVVAPDCSNVTNMTIKLRYNPSTGCAATCPEFLSSGVNAGGTYNRGSKMTIYWTLVANDWPFVDVHLVKLDGVIDRHWYDFPKDAGSATITLPTNIPTGDRYILRLYSNDQIVDSPEFKVR